jgi:hypothetical protein
VISALLFATVCFAAQPDRITGTIDSSRSVVLTGSVHAKAQPQFDQGPVDPAMTLAYVTIMTQPSAKQQAALQQLLKQQQDPASANYRKWLTPEQYANRFGLSQNDIDKLTVWLQSQGFSIVQVARAHNWIAFSGTTALVDNTFHTQIHYFNVDGERHFANATEISIPQALAGIVVGFRGLNDFRLQPMGIRDPGVAEFFPILFRPFYTSDGFHFLAPDDIATIYDITPLYNATPPIDGTGMKMVIVGQTDIDTTDIDQFRTGFNLSTINLQQVLATGSPDPGTTSDLGEADLDLEWSSAVARNATIIYVNSTNVFTSAQYAIDNNLAPVISMSYGACEATNAPLAGLEQMLQEANSEGITFLASSGDTGAAACDDGTAKVATGGLAVNYPASSPEVTGVGGNEFNEGSGTYWNTTNGANGGSATSYIPEMAWNDTPSRGTLSASGGGASSCGTGSSTTCAGFTKPSWQTGSPSDGVRDVPDVAMAASPDHDGYILCSSNSCANGIQAAVQANSIVGGTSASTPVFAGIVTLLNQVVGGSGLGNINPKLYQLAQNSSNGVFHDITTGNNIVPCTPGTPTGAPAALQCPTAGTFGYNAGAGYDQVTGLGSVDANVFVKTFSGTATATTTTTLTSSANPASSGTAITFTATVTTTGSSAPTGTVTFTADGSNVLGTSTLSGSGATSTATVQTSSLTVGGHSISAAYSGDTNNSTSTSTALTQTITGTGTVSTTTTVLANQGPVTYGSTVEFTATVATTSTPTGNMIFLDGTTPIGFSPFTTTTSTSGTATFMTSSLTVGTHSIFALYSGDSTNASSKSATAASQTINLATSTTALTASASTVFSGASVTLTATVTGSLATPTGSVTFNDGSTPLPGASTVSLNGSGVAALTTTSLATPGAHSITAVYAGNTNYSSSSSSATTVTVNAATFIFGAPPSAQTITSGGSATYKLTVIPSGNYTSQISFSCSAFSPSSSATCGFSPSTLTPGASQGTTTLTISGAQAAILVNAENRSARHVPPLYAFWMPMGVAGVFLLGGGKKSKAQSLKLFLFVAALLIVAVTMFGCGGSSGSTTPPPQQSQTYQVTVTATAPATASGSSAAVTKTQTLSLTVNP